MSHSGSDFYKPFIFVLGALVLLTFFLVFAANTLSPDGAEDPLAIAETQKAIAPIGKSRVAETVQPAAPAVEDAAAEPAPSEDVAAESSSVEAATVADEDNANQVATDSAAAAAPTETVAATASSAEASMKVKAVVATNCAGCHNDGLNGAAKTDDAEAWSALAEKGIDQLTASVINGKGQMPARAESTLSDDEIRQAVELMIANATGAAVVDSGAASAAIESTASESTATAATAVAAASTVEQAAPAEVPAAVKQVVDTACAACHISGVAGAPKFGDADAWAPRLEKGIDALVASSISGIGVMPARGGSTLNDDQMRLAVEYMLSK